MPREKLAVRIQRGVDELQCLIREQHSEAEFRVQPRTAGRNIIVIEAYGNFDGLDELMDIIEERRGELLDETGLIFLLMDMPYDERPSLKRRKTA